MDFRARVFCRSHPGQATNQQMQVKTTPQIHCIGSPRGKFSYFSAHSIFIMITYLSIVDGNLQQQQPTWRLPYILLEMV